jgi:hypothetical protein
MPNYIDLGAIGTGFKQGVELRNLFEENRRNKILEQRQNLLFEQQQKQYELEQENQNQYMKSEQLMQQKMQEAYDQNTGRIDLKKISEMYGFVKPEVFQKYSKIAGEHNSNFEAFDRDKIQDQIDLFALDKSKYEAQAQAFDIIAGKLKSGVTNPMKWQAYVNTARQNGLNIPEGIEALQTQQEREQFLSGFIDENTSLSQQQKNQLADYERNLKEQAMKRSLANENLETESKKVVLEKNKYDLLEKQQKAEKFEREKDYDHIPGFKVLPNVKITERSVNTIKEAYPKFDNVNRMVQELRALYNSVGNQLTGDEASKMESLVTLIKLDAKSPELFNLGVLNGGDAKVLDNAMPNPSSIKVGAKKAYLGNYFQNKLDAFDDYMSNKANEIYKANGFEQIEKIGRKIPNKEGWNELEVDGKKIKYKLINK